MLSPSHNSQSHQLAQSPREPARPPADQAALLHSIKIAKNFSRRNAHDFNNIIAVVQGFASILQNRLAQDAANRELAEQIEASACEALKLTSWLSSFANNNPGEMVELDLNQPVEEFLATVWEDKPESVKLRVALGQDLPKLTGDERQLERICQCLWRNAIEAMPDGGTLIWETTIEEPGASGDSGYVHLSVSDTGEGIDDCAMESIFDPFFTTKHGKDRGLGLTMVYDAVHAHGGYVEVSSQLNVGTCVDVYFPVQRADSPAATGSGKVQQFQKLMLVDDEEIIHTLVREILKSQDIEMISAATGEKAVKALQESDGSIKGVILDMTLPGMGGAATFAKLRELDPEIKIIICSGDPYQQAVRDAMEAGAFGMLAKPFTPTHFTEVVKQMLC